MVSVGALTSFKIWFKKHYSFHGYVMVVLLRQTFYRCSLQQCLKQLILALLDCISRTYSMGLSRPSVVRVAIISEPIGYITFKFQFLLALGHMHRCLGFCCCFYNSGQKKMHFPIFFAFVNTNLMGEKKLFCQTFSELSSPCSSQKVLFLEFWNFEFPICHDCISFFLTRDSMGTKTSKRYFSLKSLLDFSKLLLNFLLSGPHISAVWNFEILSLRFLTNCFRNF